MLINKNVFIAGKSCIKVVKEKKNMEQNFIVDY